jgi:hypothetical protein
MTFRSHRPPSFPCLARRGVLRRRSGVSPDSTADNCTSVAVTVYNQNLALCAKREASRSTDRRRHLRFMDVPSQINPRTVHVQPLSAGGPSVLEQNYEYDLLPGS